MDNGYSKWQEKRDLQRKNRIKFIIKCSIPILAVTLFLFLFGYDAPMFDKAKMFECSIACIGLLTIVIIIAFIKYKTTKYIPVCNTCGKEIRDIKTDCVVGNMEYLGTMDKTEYETSKSTIKGKTVYPRSGYSMRNDVMELKSESTYEVDQKMPVVKRYHVYNIEYRCKNCNELFCTLEETRLKPLHIKKHK